MIRTRSKAGETLTLSDVRFVELCDAEGLIAKLIYIDDAGGVRIVDQKDAVAQRYAKTFGAAFCPLVVLKR